MTADDQLSADSTALKPLTEQLPEIAEWLPQALQTAWQTVSAYPIIASIVIAAASYLFARLVGWLILSNLERLAKRTGNEFDDRILSVLRKPIFITIFYFGLILATAAAQLPFGAESIINLLASLIVISWLLTGMRSSTAVLEVFENSHRFSLIESRSIPLFDMVVKLILLLVASYVLLMIWGINPIGWLASAGIVGIAVGFAAKDTLANLFSGLFIMADAPYGLGDYVNLDSGERGKVTAIGMRSTRLLTRDDVEITVPNAVIAAAKITNESGGPYEKMRIRISVGASYGSDVDHVCDVLAQVAQDHEELCKYPAPRVRMRGFGASSLDFQLLAWIDRPEDRGRISHELNMAVYKAFEESGIEIPYSKHDVYIKQMPQTQ